MEFTDEISETLGRVLDPVEPKRTKRERNNVQYEKLKHELHSPGVKMWMNSEFEDGYINWKLTAEIYREMHRLIERREVFGDSGEPCLPFLLYSTREFPAGGWYNFYINRNGKMYFSYSDGKKECYSPVPEDNMMNMNGFVKLIQASVANEIREQDFSLPRFMDEFRNEIDQNLEKYLERLDELKDGAIDVF